MQIVKGVEWTGVRFDNKTPAAVYNYPVERGTYLPIDTDEALLRTQGSVRGVHLENPNYNVYKEGPQADAFANPAAPFCRRGRLA